MRKRLLYIDVLRVVCAFLIVWFHFECDFGFKFTVLRNTDAGSIANSIFFMMSGVSLGLKYKNENKINAKQFYVSRAKTLYPYYWFNYILIFTGLSAGTLLLNGKMFFEKFNWKIVLTLVGMDGYSLYSIDNFYLIGEWFFGAIIIIYLIFPFIHKLTKEYSMLTFVLLLCYQILFIETYNYDKVVGQNAFSYIFIFAFGVFFVQYEKTRSKRFYIIEVIVSIVAIAVTQLVDFPVAQIYIGFIFGIASLIIVRNIIELTKIDMYEKVNKVFKIAGGYSFTCFLVHHKVERTVYEFWGGKIGERYVLSLIIVMAAVLMLTLLSYHLFELMKKFFDNKIIKIKESKS